MFAQSPVEYILVDELAALVIHHPLGKLVMPYKTVSTHRNLVATAPVGNAVCILPFPYSLCRMQFAWLHRIFASHAVVIGENGLLFFVREVACVERHAYLEVVFVGVFKSCLFILVEDSHHNVCIPTVEYAVSFCCEMQLVGLARTTLLSLFSL